MMKQLVLFAVLCGVWLHVEARSKYVTAEEDNPYEFGFTIDGQQHRHEKKDANGIIQGEFGFITADGIYHVTVYATDENGNFKILSMRNVRLSGPLDEPNAKLPDTSQFSKSQPIAPARPPNPLSIESTPAPPPQRIEPATQSNRFTTQSTIKPACAGCGYVTHATPLNKPDNYLPYQTQAGQNPRPQDVVIGQRPIVQKQNQGQGGVVSTSGFDVPLGSNVPIVSNPVKSSGFQGTSSPNALGQFNPQNNYYENNPTNPNQNMYRQDNQQSFPGNLNNDNINTQTQGRPQQAPDTHLKSNQNLHGQIVQRPLTSINTPNLEHGPPHQILSDNQSYSGYTQQIPQPPEKSLQNQNPIHLPTSHIVENMQEQRNPNKYKTPEEPANIKYNLGSFLQEPYTPEVEHSSFDTHLPPQVPIVEEAVEQQPQKPIEYITPQAPANIKYNLGSSGSSTQTPYTSKPLQISIHQPTSRVPTLDEQQPNNQNRLQQPQTPALQNSTPQQTLPEDQAATISHDTETTQPPRPLQNTPPLQHQSHGTSLIPSQPPQISGNHNSINNQQPRQNPLVNPLTISNTPNHLNQPQSPVQPINRVTVSNGVINVPNNPPIPIQDKFPNMVDGLPAGIKEGDIIDLLYRFNYTVGFHGHYEKGYKNGAKVGGYFVNDRDGVSRIVTYVADENGYRPKVKFIRLDLNSDLVPKEGTEKTFGLKNFEFVWYPLN